MVQERRNITMLEDPLPTSTPVRKVANFLDLEQGIGLGRPPSRPTTVQGQEFILDYLQQFGSAPSPQQVSDFKRGDVSQGSMLGDEFQSTKPNVGGLMLPGEEDIGVPYTPQFAPTNEEILRNFAPSQVYQAQLRDYITGEQSTTQSVLKGFSDQYDVVIRELNNFQIANPSFTQSDYNRQLAAINNSFSDAIVQSGAMTEEKGKEILAEAERLIGQGFSPEEVNQQLSESFTIERGNLSPQGEEFRQGSFIPGISDIQGKTGAALGELLNQGLEISKTKWDIENPPAEQPTAIPTPPEEMTITGTEERDFYGLVQGLGLAREVQQYMMGRFQEFYQAWLNTGPRMRFMEWLQIQMGG